MRIGRFSHANIREADGVTPVQVIADLDLLVFWYNSPGSKATHLVAAGGAVVPVLESSQHVTNLKLGESNNDRSTEERSDANVQIRKARKK